MKEIESLVNCIVDQAKHFLADAGEFYPFGASLGADGILTPLSVLMDDDFPDSVEVLKILEREVPKRLTDKNAVAVAIGVDVIRSTEGPTKKSDAIQIKILTAEGESAIYYVDYVEGDGNLVFGPLIKEDC